MKITREEITRSMIAKAGLPVSGDVRLADFTLAELVRRCRIQELDSQPGEMPRSDYELVRDSFTIGGNMFAEAFSDALEKILLKSYSDSSPNWQRLFPERSVSQLTAEMIEYDPINSPDQVGPGGEFKKSEHGEGRTHSASLKKYGSTFEATYEAILSDDIQQLVSLVREHVDACIRLEDDKAFELLQSPTKINNKAFFSTTRGNLKTASALTEANLQKAVAALRSMKLNDVELRLRPSKLLVPAKLENTARSIVSGLYNQDDDPDRISIVVESRLTSDSTWYLTASTSQIETFVMLFLQGNRNPQITKIPKSLDCDGQKYRVKHLCQAVAAKPVGIIKNTA